MNWEIVVDNSVKKQLRRVPKKDTERILFVVEQIGVNPYSGDLEKMEGEKDAWRRRVGSYRIFYEIHRSRRLVYIYEIKRRTSKTY